MQNPADKSSLLSIRNFQVGQLQPTNLDIEPNECLSISGDSGSGKSLILRAWANLIPHQGQLYLNQQTPLQVTPTTWRKQVSYLPPKVVWWHETVGEHFHHVDASLFSQLHLSTDCLAWSANRLSSGEQQRLGLLRLLQNNPKILLLDEPTSNLDKSNILAVEQVIVDYVKQRAASAVWVSHDENQLKRIAAKTYFLHEGAIIETSVE